jgi:hypothetical protein
MLNGARADEAARSLCSRDEARRRWQYQRITMPTITVKLDSERAARLTRWARQSKIPESDIISALIDRAGPIDTGDDLIEWVEQTQGIGLGMAQAKR